MQITAARQRIAPEVIVKGLKEMLYMHCNG
jgi:hypothetical protein